MLLVLLMIQLKGERELRACLDGLGRLVSDPLMQKANAKAAEPLVHELHKRAPVGETGNLAESMGIVKPGKKNKKELGLIEIGARRKGGYKGFAAHLVEFGTKKRRVKKRHPIFGFDRGKMPKEPFIEPSWEAKKEEVLGRVTKELSNEVTKYLKRTAPK